jgi:hypothetical protein
MGCTDKTIKLVRLKDGKIIKNLNSYNNQTIFIKRINHPIYGEALVSQGLEDDSIKLWINKKINNLHIINNVKSFVKLNLKKI